MQNSLLSLEEEKSSALLIDILKEHGFSIDSVGTSNIPTAFTASYGSGSPVVGVMTEYDALPGLGNEPVAEKTPRKDGCASGHGCGHNLIGAGGLGAAMALKDWMEKNKIQGTLRVFGAAAEESEGAKIYMARDGIFDNLDACLHWHPFNTTTPWHFKCAAVNMLLIDFNGKTAHAGTVPWEGRSALHAAELFAHGIALMREHLHPTARTHYVYTNGGLAPNVVVEHAQIKLFIRDLNRPLVEATTEWVKQIAKGVHTWQATALHGMGIGHKAMIMGAKTMASLGVDLFTDAELLAAAKEDFKQRKRDYVFKSPLDPEMKKPMGLAGLQHGDHAGHD